MNNIGRILTIPEATRLLNEETAGGARPWSKKRVIRTLRALQAQLNENLLFRSQTSPRRPRWQISYENFRRCFPEKPAVACSAHAEATMLKCIRSHGARLDEHEDDIAEMRRLLEQAIEFVRALKNGNVAGQTR